MDATCGASITGAGLEMVAGGGGGGGGAACDVEGIARGVESE